jgi:hypothetical protein
MKSQETILTPSKKYQQVYSTGQTMKKLKSMMGLKGTHEKDHAKYARQGFVYRRMEYT